MKIWLQELTILRALSVPAARAVKTARALLALCCLTVAVARAGSVTVDVSPQDIYEGESFQYRLTVRQMDNAQPDLSEIQKQFDVAGPSVSTSMSIIGGRMDSSAVYTYQLTPRKTGAMTIPAPTVKDAGGQTATGRALTVSVRPIEKSDLAMMEISCNRKAVYPTQPFDITLKIWVLGLERDDDRDPLSILRQNFPAIQANWVNPVPEGLTPEKDPPTWLNGYLANNGRHGYGFSLNGLSVSSGFFNSLALLNIHKGRETREGPASKKQHNYHVYELTRRFTPARSGRFEFGPATLNGTLAVLQGNNYVAQRAMVASNALTVEVKEPPEPRPAGFCGGIGPHRAKSSVSAAVLRVGDPITYTLEIERGEGAGSLDLVFAPDLSKIKEFADNFEIPNSSPTGQTNANTKTFSYEMRVKKAGASVPGYAITVFDIDSEKYAQVQVPPVKLSVEETQKMQATELVGALASKNNREIKASGQGIFQNITSLDELGNQHSDPEIYAITALTSWLVCGLMHLVLWRVRSRAGDVAWQRRSGAWREAKSGLAAATAAAKSGNKTEACTAASHALCGLIGNMLNIPSAGMTAADARAALDKAGIGAELRDKTGTLLEAVEASQYGSGGSALEGVIAEAETLLPALHKALDNRKA